ncbi:MAG TPA: phosphoglycerate kinase [Rectinema sp.]|nr:phosphoglycerate kinase [Rectinema sp.]
MEGPRLKIKPFTELELTGKTVIFRPDINSPIDPKTKRIVNTNRIEKTVPTLNSLLEQGAKVALIAHQGDTLDYQNLIPLAEHAEILSRLTGRRVSYIDDVCGPAAQAAVKALLPGEAIILGNLRYLTEEISTFETVVKLTPQEMTSAWLVRSLAPLGDYYVNDAFAAAHRNSPSMVAFQELLPSAGGFQLMDEYTALKSVKDSPRRPCVYILGGAKISDAFDMMRKVLTDGSADYILTAGITGIVMHIGRGVDFGPIVQKFLIDHGLDVFIPEAKALLREFGERYVLPVDLAYDENAGLSQANASDIANASAFPEQKRAPTSTSTSTSTSIPKRSEALIEALPKDRLFPDIGHKTIELFKKYINSAGSIFVNGPAGMYETEPWADGTRELWRAIADAPGYTVIGGGDTISAATKFTELSKYGYVCTGGGAMVRFLAGKQLPLIEAMERAFERDFG